MRSPLTLASLCLLLLGCSDGPPDPPPQPCTSDADCTASERCTSQGVAEISLEPTDTGLCTPNSEVIGQDPNRWPFRPGGRSLAERLCVAQGLARGTSDTATALRARQFELLAAAGAKRTRIDFKWSQIEAAAGEWDFSSYDAMVDEASKAGVELIPVLAYGTPWASSLTTDDDKFPPDDAADYAAFAAAVTRRYADRIQSYELWNEPNAGYRFFKPQLHGDAAQFADMLSAGAKAVHSECANCTVISGGLFFHEQLINGAVEFTHDMLSARPNALDDVDALGLHPYPLYPPKVAPENDEGAQRALGGMVHDLERVLSLHDVELPIAGTELGWPSFGELDEETQAAFLSRAHLLAAALGLDPLCWYNLVDGADHGTFPPEHDFGLYRYGSADPEAPVEAKPARDALAWLAKVGEAAIPAGSNEELHAPEDGIFAIDFETPSGLLTALWRIGEGSEGVEAPTGGRTVHDALGQPLNATKGVIELGSAPVFLVP